MIRLVLSDVDGTLVTSAKQLAPSTLEAARRLRSRGIALALTSSRPPRGMAMLVGPLELTAPIAAYNGGLLVKPDLRTVLVERLVPRPVAARAIDLLEAAGLDAWVFRGNSWFVRDRRAPHVEREQVTVQFAATVVSDLHAVLDGAAKIVGVSDDFPAVAQCEATLRAQLGGAASAGRSQPYYLDVTHPDANKGTVLRDLARMLGISPPQIAAIGDMHTDLAMLELAGLPIAMGNAEPEVQRAARFVTTSNDDDGFANAVARILGDN